MYFLVNLNGKITAFLERPAGPLSNRRLKSALLIKPKHNISSVVFAIQLGYRIQLMPNPLDHRKISIKL